MARVTDKTMQDQNPISEKSREWRGAHPALWIALFGIFIAFAWEMLQLPFY